MTLLALRLLARRWATTYEAPTATSTAKATPSTIPATLPALMPPAALAGADHTVLASPSESALALDAADRAARCAHWGSPQGALAWTGGERLGG